MADDSPLVTPPEALVTQIASGIEGVSAEQVSAVLAGLAAAQSGDQVGTLMQDTSTGAVAQRIILDGVHMWRVTKPNGEMWYDMSPKLDGWSVLYSPSP